MKRITITGISIMLLFMFTACHYLKKNKVMRRVIVLEETVQPSVDSMNLLLTELNILHDSLKQKPAYDFDFLSLSHRFESNMRTNNVLLNLIDRKKTLDYNINYTNNMGLLLKTIQRNLQAGIDYIHVVEATRKRQKMDVFIQKIKALQDEFHDRKMISERKKRALIEAYKIDMGKYNKQKGRIEHKNKNER